MNLINEEFAEDLFEWAKRKEDKKVFPFISEEDSYYISRDSEETYMMEYMFQSVTEFWRAMERYSGLCDDLQLLNRLVVELYQSRFNSKAEKNEQNSEKIRYVTEEEIAKKTLPEYIYVF